MVFPAGAVLCSVRKQCEVELDGPMLWSQEYPIWKISRVSVATPFPFTEILPNGTVIPSAEPSPSTGTDYVTPASLES